LTSITDGDNHTTQFAYDELGRVTKTTFPSTLFETYGYDGLYNLTSKTDRKNQTIQYVYDSLYRQSTKTYPDQSDATYIYDLVGKIKQVTDPTGVYGFAYDNMGRLIGTTTQYTFLPGHNFQNGYTYDGASNRKSLIAPDGSTNTYNYDTLNRLATLTNSMTGQFGFGYYALSRRTQLTRPNGVNTNYNYDSVSHLLSVLHQAGSTTLDGASYGYDFAGNRTSKTNYLNGITANYGYDAIYELLQVTQGGSTTESYSYDAVGNRLSSTGVPTYSYNSSNELTSNSSGSYTYDNNGNTLTDASGKSYTWDFDNRMVSAVVPGTGTVTFKYDPFGRRIYKSSFLGTGIFAFDGDNLIEEINTSGGVVARYSQTMNIDEPLSEFRGGTTNYYEADGLGSVTSLTSTAAVVAQTYTFDSFGKLAGSSGSLTNPFGHSGREFDTEANLYFDRARYYDPSIGRFASEDPIGFQGGMNHYAYTGNRPIDFVDSFGLRVNQNGIVLSNPLVLASLQALNSLIAQSGVADDCFVLLITGGDRYRDPKNPHVIRSASNNRIISNSDPNSPHLDSKGARAVDFVIQNKGGCGCDTPVTDALVDQLLPSTNFNPPDTRRNYPEGPHTHVNLPNRVMYYPAP
jgi:RHS repeat-associated protein